MSSFVKSVSFTKLFAQKSLSMDVTNSFESVELAGRTKFPKVTVITATYNAERHLESCISSVLNQSYKNLEYIIIDGGSTDNTVNIVRKYQDKLKYWVSEPDIGIYDAWNKGIYQATGDWIAFIGADDEYMTDAIQLYIEHITNHTKSAELHFVSSRIDLVDESLFPIRVVGEAWEWERFKKSMITWHVGTLHARSLFEKFGLFDPSFKISGDYELLLRPKDHLIASFFDLPTIKMRSGGISGKNLIRASDETYRAKVKNGLLSPAKGWILKLLDRIRLMIRSNAG